MSHEWIWLFGSVLIPPCFCLCHNLVSTSLWPLFLATVLTCCIIFSCFMYIHTYILIYILIYIYIYIYRYFWLHVADLYLCIHLPCVHRVWLCRVVVSLWLEGQMCKPRLLYSQISADVLFLLLIRSCQFTPRINACMMLFIQADFAIGWC